MFTYMQSLKKTVGYVSLKEESMSLDARRKKRDPVDPDIRQPDGMDRFDAATNYDSDDE
jgi:hypothetical protein